MPIIITKIPFLHSFEKKRDKDIDGEEYGAYLPINQSLGNFESQILPVKVFEHFINKASNIVVRECGCRLQYDCQEFAFRNAISSGVSCSKHLHS